MTRTRCDATAQAWDALGGKPELLERISYGGPSGSLPARLPVGELARATVAACSLAAAELAALRTGRPVPAVRVDDGAVATAFTSERHLRVDGRVGATFAPLSGFWPAADGWVRTHANYPHHRARLTAALGIAEDTGDPVGAERLAAAIRELPAEEVQERAYAAGGLAVAVRTADAWAAHEQGRAAAARPLVAVDRVAGQERAAAPLPPLAAEGTLLPARGVRVLDLTRVIAGPVATRTLALLGADVLRVDSPRLPESEDAHADTGFGKRSALLDLADRADRAVFEELLGAADVVVTGYRPGALDRFGLAPEALLERRPGLVVARLSAWGDGGPWAGRRGFDSLVQASCGIADTEAAGGSVRDGGRPGVLPAQALDHGTGYLMAAAVLRALSERQSGAGGGRVVRLALATTAHWLTRGITAPAAPDAPDGPEFSPRPWLAERDAPMGRLTYALPPVSFEGGPDDWPTPPGRWGTDKPLWP